MKKSYLSFLIISFVLSVPLLLLSQATFLKEGFEYEFPSDYSIIFNNNENFQEISLGIISDEKEEEYRVDANTHHFETCLPIEENSIIIDSTTLTSAFISFTPTGNENKWEIAYGIRGFEPSIRSNIVTVYKCESAEIPLLKSGVYYDFYVRANCDENGTSRWKGPITGYTKQLPATTPYICAFDDGEDEDHSTNWKLLGTSENKWTIGSKTIGGPLGRKSLYISYDNDTNQMVQVNANETRYAHAVRQINLEQGLYDCAFYWKGYGSSANNLRAFIVPADIEIQEDLSNGISNVYFNTLVPDGWYDMAQGGIYNTNKPANIWNKNYKQLQILKTGNYQIVFMWKTTGSLSSNTATNPPIALDSIMIIPNKTTCGELSNIRTVHRSQTTATIDFTASNSTERHIRLSTEKLDLNTIEDIHDSVFIVAETTEKIPYTFYNLESGTKYYYYIKTDCNSSCVINSFITHCSPQRLPYLEDFEEYTSGTNMPPPCWSTHYTSTNGLSVNTPIVSNQSPYGKRCIVLPSAANRRNYSSTPAFDIEDISTQRITFWYRMTNLNDELTVGVSENPDDISTFTPIHKFKTEQSSKWLFKEIWLDSYEGEGKYISFYIENTSGNILIDYITVDSIPPSPTPTDLEVNDIKYNEAKLAWNGNSGKKHHLKVSTKSLSDFEKQKANVFDDMVEEESAVIKGLKAESTYYFYVKALGVNEASDWSEEKEFTTICREHFLTPYEESFENYISEEIPCSWIRIMEYNTLNKTYPCISNDQKFSGQNSLHVNAENNDFNLIVFPLDNKEDLSKLTLSFYIYNAKSSEQQILVGVMKDITDESSFVQIDTIVLDFQQNWEYVEVDLSKYSGSGKYVGFKTSGQETEMYIDEVRIFDKNKVCPIPTNLLANSITASSALLKWSERNYEADYFQIKYDVMDFDPYEDLERVMVIDSAINRSYPLDNLEANTTYYFYVKSFCGDDESYWSETGTFTTTCEAITLSYFDHFDTYGIPTNITNKELYPICWKRSIQEFGNVSSNYIFPPYISNVGEGTENPSASLTFHPYWGSSGDEYSIITAITPEINVGKIKDCQMTFKYMGKRNAVYPLEIGVMTDWLDPASFSVVDILYIYGDGEWREHLVNFNLYKRDGKYIAFRMSGLDVGAWATSTSTGTYAYIDSLTIDSIPECAISHSISASNVSDTGVVMNWTAGNESYHEWEYLLTDTLISLRENDWFSIKNKALKTDTVYSTKHEINDLNPSHTYYFYIKSVCSENAYFPNPVAFTTACDPIDSFPYCIRFNNYPELASSRNATYIPCWTRKSSIPGATTYPYVRVSNTLAGKDTVLFMTGNNHGFSLAISPKINAENIGKLRVSLKANQELNNNGYILAGYMTDNENFSTFIPTDTIIPVSTQSESFKIYFDKEQINGNYLAFYAKEGLTVNYTNIGISEITLEEAPTIICDEPAWITPNTPTQNSFQLDWQNEGDEWEIAYGIQGFNPDSCKNSIITQTNSFVIKNLEPNTLYEMYVRSICEDNVSKWTGPAGCLTLQIPTDAPFVCDFEDEGINAGWSLVQYGMPNQWMIGETTYKGETGKSLYISCDSSSYKYNSLSNNNQPSAVWAYRTLHLKAGRYTISYDWKCPTKTSTDAMRVMLVPADVVFEPGNTSGVLLFNNESPSKNTPDYWINIGKETSSSGNTWTYYSGLYNNQNKWTSYSQEIEIKRDTTYHLAIHFQINSYSDTNGKLPAAIDNIKVVPSECVAPFNLWADNLTTSSAEVKWKGSEQDAWKLKVSRYPLLNPENSTAYVFDGEVDNPFHPLSNLNNGTTYYFYVKSVCSPMNTWSVGSFSTLCPPLDETLSEDFENSLLPPDCWTIYPYMGLASDVFEGNKGKLLTTEYNSITTTKMKDSNAIKFEFKENYAPFSTWLVTPLVSLSSLQESVLTFDLAFTQNNDDADTPYPIEPGNQSFMVIVSTDEGITWKKENATIWSSTENNDYDLTEISPIRSTYSIDLSSYKGNTIRIAFYAETLNAYNKTEEINCIKLDNVSISCANSYEHLDKHFQNHPYQKYGFNIPAEKFDFSGDTVITRIVKGEGCDSIITINLTVIGSVITPICADICNGETYHQYGFQVSEEGIYEQVYTAESGADSIVKLHLSVMPSYEFIENVQVCPAALPFEWRGKKYYSNGNYTHTLETVNKCDSTYILSLQVVSQIENEIHTTICKGDFYEFNGEKLSESNTYYANFESKWGCDSLVTLHLKVVDKIEIYHEATICPEGVFNGFGFTNKTEEGTWTNYDTSAFGCDSTFTLKLSVSRTVGQIINERICEGQYYTDNGFYENQAGIYRDTLVAVNGGCDSIVTLNLTLMPSYTVSDELTIDRSKLPYNYNGYILPEDIESGIHEIPFITSLGCDSTVILTLSLSDGVNLYSPDDSLHDLIIEPNPVQKGGLVFINYPFTPDELSGIKVEVFNGNGILIKSFVPASDKISITDLEYTGIYLIRVTTGSGKELYGKIIVQ